MEFDTEDQVLFCFSMEQKKNRNKHFSVHYFHFSWIRFCYCREVFETPGSRVVADLLVKEGLAVAKAEGVNIPEDEADHILEKVVDKKCENSGNYTWPGYCFPPREQDLHVRGCS